MKIGDLQKLTIFVFFWVLFPPNFTSADIGPKPTMEFNFVYETASPINIISGQQIECEDKDCLKSHPLESLGPQGFRCEQNLCRSVAYGYSSYHKLIIKFSDKTRESNIFKVNSYNAKFNLKVTNSDLMAQEIIYVPFRELLPFFLQALIATLVIEILVALLFLSITKTSKKVLTSILIANIVSLPIVWFVFPLLRLPSRQTIIIPGIFAIVLEACLIFFLNRQRISFKKSFVLSFVINIVSLIFGTLILNF